MLLKIFLMVGEDSICFCFMTIQVENERAYHRRAAELLDQIQAHVHTSHLCTHTLHATEDY